MTTFSSLPLIDLAPDQNIGKPRPFSLLQLEDSIEAVYVDFSKQRCRCIDPSEKLSYAERIMDRDCAHELLVEQDQVIIGVLGINATRGPKAMKLAEKQRTTHDKLLTKHVMTPINEIPVISESVLKHAKIGNLVSTMNDQKARYLLVADSTNRLVGLCSIDTISHALHKNVAASAGLSSSFE